MFVHEGLVQMQSNLSELRNCAVTRYNTWFVPVNEGTLTQNGHKSYGTEESPKYNEQIIKNYIATASHDSVPFHHTGSVKSYSGLELILSYSYMSEPHSYVLVLLLA